MRNGFEAFGDLKVALCHDWLTGMRGGERVLEVLCDGFPDAPVCALFANPDAVSGRINSHALHTSWLQRLPGITRRYRCLLPFFPHAIEHLRVPPGDLVISTSHCVAKGVPTGPATRHLCYCFTPMRYAWTFQREYLGARSAKRFLAAPVLAALRGWDRRTATRVDRFVAISNHVADRIRSFYGRECDVVYPPVNTEFWTPDGRKREEFDLIVSALVPYKRVDLAVRAYTQSGYPLRVVGVGSGRRLLEAAAGPNVSFLGWQNDETVRDLYRSCRQLVFPGQEDFGIVPLEAQACGAAVVAFGRGGALETVCAGVSGLFFPRQAETELLAAVDRAAGTSWNRDAIRAHAEMFGRRRFIEGLSASIRACLAPAGTGPESS